MFTTLHSSMELIMQFVHVTRESSLRRWKKCGHTCMMFHSCDLGGDRQTDRHTHTQSMSINTIDDRVFTSPRLSATVLSIWKRGHISETRNSFLFTNILVPDTTNTQTPSPEAAHIAEAAMITAGGTSTKGQPCQLSIKKY